MSFISISAQKSNISLEFSETFTHKTNNQYFGSIRNIENKEKSSFISLSAYCINPNIQTIIQYRFYSENKWSNWQQLKEDKEVNNTKRKVFGLITLFNQIEKIQFKSSKSINKQIRFRLYIANDKEIVNHNYKEINNCDLPTYCDRSCWCPSGDCTPQSSPSYTEVTHVIVHHSGTNYSSDTDYKQVVYSYWDYHVNTHGWNDIGYNWLVDPNGVLYEGRGNEVQGAHFSCMNGNTMGVCVIGNFQTAIPTVQTLSTLEELIAWEATDKGIDVITSSYHPPSQLNLQHISGHREGNSSSLGCPSGTVCPGNHLYNKLPTIRNNIASFSCYVTDNEIISPIKLFPNPINGILNIKKDTNTSINQILIYNSLGLIIKSIIYPKNTIDFSNIRTGVYFVKIINTTNIYTFTVYKM
jgi:hypothetical protein